MPPVLIGLELTDGSILIACVAGVSPVAMAWVTAHLARTRQREDWERQDLVERRVAQATEKLSLKQERTQLRIVEQAEEAAVALAAVTDRSRRDAARIEGKIDQVHVLVNSKLTESMYRQAAVLGQLIELMTGDIVRLGTDADPGAVERRNRAIEDLNRLQVVLSDRETATAMAEEVESATDDVQ